MGQQPWDQGTYQPTSGQAPPPGGYQPDPAMGSSGGSGGGGDYAVPIMVGLGVIVILVVAIFALLLAGGGDGDEETSSTDPTTTESQPTETTAAPEPGGGGQQSQTGTGTENLPAPDVSVEASPPQLHAGIEGMEYPVGLDERVPILGEVAIDLPQDGYVDVAVHLEEGEVYMLASANDRIGAHFEVYDPDGAVIAEWTDEGEPDVVQGWEFSQEDTLTQSGTYVFRVISANGGTGQFPLRFFR